MTNQDIIAQADQVIIKTYGRYPVAFVRGQGCVEEWGQESDRQKARDSQYGEFQIWLPGAWAFVYY